MPPSESIRALARACVVGADLLRQPVDQADGGLRLDPAGRDPDHANALRAHLLGQALAVVRERGLRGGVGDGGLGQRQLPLDRGDVDDDAGAPLEHRRQQRAIQPHGREQVQVERALPLPVVEHREAARGRRRAADDMDDDVDRRRAASATASATAAQPSAVAMSAATNRSPARGSVGRRAGGGRGRSRRARAAAPRRLRRCPCVPPVTSARRPASSRSSPISGSPARRSDRRRRSRSGRSDSRAAGEGARDLHDDDRAVALDATFERLAP